MPAGPKSEDSKFVEAFSMACLPFPTVMNENTDKRMFLKTERKENKNEKCVMGFGL